MSCLYTKFPVTLHVGTSNFFEVLIIRVRSNGVILGRKCIEGAEAEEHNGTGAPTHAGQMINLRINKQMLLKFRKNISSCASFSRALTGRFRYLGMSLCLPHFT